MTLDDLAAGKSQWPTLAELISSEQVPANRVADICRNVPDFAAWLEGREIQAPAAIEGALCEALT